MRAEEGGPGRPEASEAVHVDTGRLRLEGRDHEHPDHQEAERPQVRRDPAAEHVGGGAAPCAFDGGPGAGADAREHTRPDGRAGRVGSHRQLRSREREAGETRSQRGHDPHRDAGAGRRDDDTGEHRRLRPQPGGAAAGPGGQPHEPDREGHRHEVISEVGRQAGPLIPATGANVTTISVRTAARDTSSPILTPPQTSIPRSSRDVMIPSA